MCICFISKSIKICICHKYICPKLYDNKVLGRKNEHYYIMPYNGYYSKHVKCNQIIFKYLKKYAHIMNNRSLKANFYQSNFYLCKHKFSFTVDNVIKTLNFLNKARVNKVLYIITGY